MFGDAQFYNPVILLRFPYVEHIKSSQRGTLVYVLFIHLFVCLFIYLFNIYFYEMGYDLQFTRGIKRRTFSSHTEIAC